MTQTVARGATLSSKYGRLGGFSGPMVAPPGKAVSFFFGLPGEGKSAFVQSNPSAFIFNLDASSTTTPHVKATIFPGIDPNTGAILGDSGLPTSLSWSIISDKIKVLGELAASGAPRPETIVFDSLSSWIALLTQWIPPNAVQLGISKEPAAEWRHLHGPAAWDTLYTIITTTLTSLRNLGYGVIVIGHVVNAKIPLEENRYVLKPELTITDGFWKRLYHHFELSALIFADHVTETYDDVTTTVIRGETKTSNVKRTRSVLKHFMSVAKLELAGISKCRVDLPERIELPRIGAWAAFETAYMAGVKPQGDPS